MSCFFEDAECPHTHALPPGLNSTNNSMAVGLLQHRIGDSMQSHNCEDWVATWPSNWSCSKWYDTFNREMIKHSEMGKAYQSYFHNVPFTTMETKEWVAQMLLDMTRGEVYDPEKKYCTEMGGGNYSYETLQSIYRSAKITVRPDIQWSKSFQVVSVIDQQIENLQVKLNSMDVASPPCQQAQFGICLKPERCNKSHHWKWFGAHKVFVRGTSVTRDAAMQRLWELHARRFPGGTPVGANLGAAAWGHPRQDPRDEGQALHQARQGGRPTRLPPPRPKDVPQAREVNKNAPENEHGHFRGGASMENAPPAVAPPLPKSAPPLPELATTDYWAALAETMASREPIEPHGTPEARNALEQSTHPFYGLRKERDEWSSDSSKRASSAPASGPTVEQAETDRNTMSSLRAFVFPHGVLSLEHVGQSQIQITVDGTSYVQEWRIPQYWTIWADPLTAELLSYQHPDVDFSPFAADLGWFADMFAFPLFRKYNAEALDMLITMRCVYMVETYLRFHDVRINARHMSQCLAFASWHLSMEDELSAPGEAREVTLGMQRKPGSRKLIMRVYTPIGSDLDLTPGDDMLRMDRILDRLYQFFGPILHPADSGSPQAGKQWSLQGGQRARQAGLLTSDPENKTVIDPDWNVKQLKALYHQLGFATITRVRCYEMNASKLTIVKERLLTILSQASDECLASTDWYNELPLMRNVCELAGMQRYYDALFSRSLIAAARIKETIHGPNWITDRAKGIPMSEENTVFEAIQKAKAVLGHPERHEDSWDTDDENAKLEPQAKRQRLTATGRWPQLLSGDTELSARPSQVFDYIQEAVGRGVQDAVDPGHFLNDVDIAPFGQHEKSNDPTSIQPYNVDPVAIKGATYVEIQEVEPLRSIEQVWGSTNDVVQFRRTLEIEVAAEHCNITTPNTIRRQKDAPDRAPWITPDNVDMEPVPNQPASTVTMRALETIGNRHADMVLKPFPALITMVLKKFTHLGRAYDPMQSGFTYGQVLANVVGKKCRETITQTEAFSWRRQPALRITGTTPTFLNLMREFFCLRAQMARRGPTLVELMRHAKLPIEDPNRDYSTIQSFHSVDVVTSEHGKLPALISFLMAAKPLRQALRSIQQSWSGVGDYDPGNVVLCLMFQLQHRVKQFFEWYIDELMYENNEIAEFLNILEGSFMEYLNQFPRRPEHVKSSSPHMWNDTGNHEEALQHIAQHVIALGSESVADPVLFDICVRYHAVSRLVYGFVQVWMNMVSSEAQLSLASNYLVAMSLTEWIALFTDKWENHQPEMEAQWIEYWNRGNTDAYQVQHIHEMQISVTRWQGSLLLQKYKDDLSKGYTYNEHVHVLKTLAATIAVELARKTIQLFVDTQWFEPSKESTEVDPDEPWDVDRTKILKDCHRWMRSGECMFGVLCKFQHNPMKHRRDKALYRPNRTRQGPPCAENHSWSLFHDQLSAERIPWFGSRFGLGEAIGTVREQRVDKGTDRFAEEYLRSREARNSSLVEILTDTETKVSYFARGLAEHTKQALTVYSAAVYDLVEHIAWSSEKNYKEMNQDYGQDNEEAHPLYAVLVGLLTKHLQEYSVASIEYADRRLSGCPGGCQLLAKQLKAQWLLSSGQKLDTLFSLKMGEQWSTHV